MLTLKSIICFNGGTGGDFLKSICLTQLPKTGSFRIEESGMIEFQSHYFKLMCEKYYEQPFDWQTLEQSLIFSVENSHYYFDWFHQISSKVYYIDYPDNMTDAIFDTFINKRYPDQLEKFVKKFLSKFPTTLQNKISINDAVTVIKKNWKQNQQRWRNNSKMHPIALIDLFDLDKIKKITCELVQQRPLTTWDLIEQLHFEWTTKNQNLHSSCLESMNKTD